MKFWVLLLKEIKTPPPACSEKWKKGKILTLAPAVNQSARAPSWNQWVFKILLQVVFLFCRRGEKDQLKKQHLIDSGKKLISFKMSLQEKNSILSNFCRNHDNFVLQCLRIGSHFLKWQIVKSKYSHNLAENKIAPIASRETHNVICTKRALVIMCSCNRLVIYLCAVWWHTCVQLWHIYSVCMSVWSNTFYSLLWWHKERAQGHVDYFPFFLLSLTSTFSLYTNNHY